MIAPVTSLFIFACFVIYLRDWIQVSLHSQLYDNNSQFWRQALEGLCYLGAPREHVEWSIDVGGSFGFEECSLCISGNHTAHYHDNSLHGVYDPKKESRLGLFADHVLCRNGRRRRRSTSGSQQPSTFTCNPRCSIPSSVKNGLDNHVSIEVPAFQKKKASRVGNIGLLPRSGMRSTTFS